MLPSGPCGPEPRQAASAEADLSGGSLRPTSTPDEAATVAAAREFYARLERCGRTFADAGVVALNLAHGTFAGNDWLGLVTELARVAPGLCDVLRRVGKGAVDLVAGETGNFTPAYAARLERGLSAGAGRPFPVRLFHWSGQNNHVARADGAVNLLVELDRRAAELPAEAWADPRRPPRVQLWGHSHGGNMLAILTNLLAADEATRAEFFAAARPFYHSWLAGRADLPAWSAAEQLLADQDRPVRRLRLDVVTFGTPIRYGWDTSPPAPAVAEPSAPSPPAVGDVLTARHGDYVQQIGIAGTNLCVAPLTLRTFKANRRLGRLLEAGVDREGLRSRLRRGVRVAAEGTTLLVAYADPDRSPLRHLWGHGLYTRTRWLAWHCERIAEELYGGDE